MGREQKRKVPLEAVFQRVGSPTHFVVGPGCNAARLTVMAVVARNQSVVRTGENDIRVFRPRRNPAAFASADRIPLAFTYASAGTASCNLDGRIVLLRAVRMIRKIVVERDTIKLGRGLVVLRGPILSTIGTDIHTSVIRLDHALRIARCK